MKRTLIICLVAVLSACACKRVVTTPRPTIPLVLQIAADTAGLRPVAATAGHQGARGAIALVGEPSEVLSLSRRFQHADWVDNISGDGRRDSLPDFAGEEFQLILDGQSAPYAHFFPDEASPVEDGPEALREVAVMNALFAWDSTCVEHTYSRPSLLRKSRSKILIYTSPFQARFGLFDVDTLQQLTGGLSRVLSPLAVMLDEAAGAGASNVAVWASRALRLSGAVDYAACENAFSGRVTVLTPESALDVRTQLRNLLRQYQANGTRLDALLLTDYDVDTAPLLTELKLIRQSAAEEDRAFSRLIAPEFFILDPATSLIRATYRLLRQENLFTHRIALPVVSYYDTAESITGETVLREVSAQYVQSAYVSDIH